MSKLFGYDFWFKNRTPKFPLGNRFGRHPYRNMYRLIASLIVLVYILISQNDMVKNFDNSMKTAMIAAGELPDENISQNGIYDTDDKFIKKLSGIGFRKTFKNNSKIVIYRKGYNGIEAYKNSPDWNKTFKFEEYSTTRAKSNKIFEKYCGEICIIDIQKKKYIAIPKDKASDEKYLYETLSKFYN